MKTSAWIVSICIYYAAVFILCPRVHSWWLLQLDDLLFFGIIPLVAAVIGTYVYRDQIQFALCWIVFGLAIAAICLSFLPLRLAVGLPPW